MEWNKDKMNHWDCLVSVSSGALTALLDVLWVQDLSLHNAHQWGVAETEKFVISAAKSKGYRGPDNDFGAAVSYLERMFPLAADKLTNEFGGGAYHHLRDFSHHPTIIGLLFSIVSQFTGKGYGTDRSGQFKSYPIPGWKRPNYCNGVYRGTVMWLFHMISDMAGSSSTIKMGREGTGLPGPILSFMKELSSIPLIQALTKSDANGNNQFSVICSKLFTGTLLGEHDENGKIIQEGKLGFDFRTELGIAHEALTHKQYIPVIINELVVCSFYSVSRFCGELSKNQISTIDDLKNMDATAFLPWNSAALRHMRTLATVTFSVIDISVAITQAKIKHHDNIGGFALDFLQKINYFGIFHLAMAASAETADLIEQLKAKICEISDKQKRRLYESVPNTDEILNTLKKAGITAGAILQIGTPLGFLSAAVGVYDEIANTLKDLHIAHQERLLVEEQCRIQLEIIRENQVEIEQMVYQYMYDHLYGFGKALDQMSAALTSGDTEQYLQGNAAIQGQLGGQTQFETQDDFDGLMSSDQPLQLGGKKK